MMSADRGSKKLLEKDVSRSRDQENVKDCCQPIEGARNCKRKISAGRGSKKKLEKLVSRSRELETVRDCCQPNEGARNC